MGNEESLVGFPVKQVVPALVSSYFVLKCRHCLCRAYNVASVADKI